MAGNEGQEPAPGAGTPPVRIDTSVAHIARVQDYWLGGRDNFAADRQAGEEAVTAFPGLVASVRSTRSFLARTVRYLTAEEGVRQFLDIGSGIPTAGNTHEVAQAIAPDALVVYMDNDPVVFAHARGLLASGPHGNTAYLGTDLRDTGTVLAERGPAAGSHPAGRAGPHVGAPVHPGRGGPLEDRRHPDRRAGAGQLPGRRASGQ